MSKPNRMLFSNIPTHVINTGINNEICFFDQDDYQLFSDFIKEESRTWNCSVYAYVILNNAFHLLVSSVHPANISKFVKSLTQRYVYHINTNKHRTGTLWNGRFKSSLIQPGTTLVDCQRYIERLPVLKGIAASEKDYTWSSWHENNGQKAFTIITQHPSQIAYKKKLNSILSKDVECQFEQAAEGGYLIGNDEFRVEIQRLLM